VLRAVIDVNVLVSGLLRPGSSSPPARIRHDLTTGSIRAVASPDLVSELDEVLHRRKLARYLSTADADRAVTEIRRTAEMHYPEEAPTPISRAATALSSSARRGGDNQAWATGQSVGSRSVSSR
jgi:hypothetical protein